jgi:hypothetical protein
MDESTTNETKPATEEQPCRGCGTPTTTVLRCYSARAPYCAERIVNDLTAMVDDYERRRGEAR